MKNLTKFIVVIILILTVFTLFSCNNDNDEPQSKEVVLIIADKDLNELARYERESKGYLSDLMLEITKEENSTFSFDSTISLHGQFVNSITVETDPETWEKTGLFPDSSKNEFIALYHNIDTPEQRAYAYDALDYDSQSFYSAANGIDATPLVEGGFYLITISFWS